VPETDEVMIELIQKMNRQPGRDRETIGFTVMKVFHHVDLNGEKCPFKSYYLGMESAFIMKNFLLHRAVEKIYRLVCHKLASGKSVHAAVF
jgi:hypothetical protein